MDSDTCGRHGNEESPHSVVSEISDSDLNTCLVPLPEGRQRFQAKITSLKMPLQRHFEVTVTGLNLECNPVIGPHVMTVPSCDQNQGDCPQTNICINRPSAVMTTGLKECKYKCRCPETCEYIILDLHRYNGQQQENWTFCEVF